MVVDGYVYLASPYSSPEAAVRQARYESVAAYTAKLLCGGWHVYSPIVHCHEIAVRFALPTDFVFWERYNFAMLSSAKQLFVLEIPGVKESKGVVGEIAEAERLRIPVIFVTEKDYV